jgi:FtsZ-interacting cell division protein YlmF
LKGAFFISQPLKGLVLEILKDILTSSKFQYIMIITNVNPRNYDETMDYFDTIKDNCLIWMENPVIIFL